MRRAPKLRSQPCARISTKAAAASALLARLVTGMGGGAIAALSVDHAGAAIFLTALSIGSGQDRDLAVLSTNDRQLARLALALRAARVSSPQRWRNSSSISIPTSRCPKGSSNCAPTAPLRFCRPPRRSRPDNDGRGPYLATCAQRCGGPAG